MATKKTDADGLDDGTTSSDSPSIPSRRSDYTPTDFAGWRASDSLVLSPKFQRRSVWKAAARSFFIDSLLRGMPVPPLYLRETQSNERNRTIREVVDGQQRISAVLDYLENRFRLARTPKAQWSGKTFNDLSQADKDRLSAYPFSTVVFPGIADTLVLQIFSRLNTYSVALNKQELRNGKYFGAFKQSVYAIAYEHLEFWRRFGIFTEINIARMHEAEFVSEIYAAFLEGMQDKKGSIDSFYERFDNEFKGQMQVEKRFREVVDEVIAAVGEALPDTVFRRPPVLYSLFCAIYHRRYGLPGVDFVTPKKALTRVEQDALRDAVISLSEIVENSKTGAVPQKYQNFVAACLQQTDNIKPRQTRLSALYRAAFG